MNISSEIIDKQTDLGILISHIVTNFLPNYYSICVFWKSFEFELIFNTFMQQLRNNNFNFTIVPVFYLFRIQNDFRLQSKTLITAVNFGCQVPNVLSLSI